MQSGQAEFKSIMVWNPFVLQTLRKRSDAKVLFDSTKIPEEIIDMVVVGKDSLAKPGGKRFAFCIAEAFYRVSQLIEAADSRDRALKTLGEKFGSSSLDDMKVIVEQTKFYKTPETALAYSRATSSARKPCARGSVLCVPRHQRKGTQLQLRTRRCPAAVHSEFLTGLKENVDPSSIK